MTDEKQFEHLFSPEASDFLKRLSFREFTFRCVAGRAIESSITVGGSRDDVEEFIERMREALGS